MITFLEEGHKPLGNGVLIQSDKLRRDLANVQENGRASKSVFVFPASLLLTERH